jgi:molybdenum cofactor synthesis domain-containing protein
MPNPTAAMLVIGDEILSGRTRDANMYYLAGRLTEAGIDLKEVRVVADDTAGIVNAVNALRSDYTHVFTSGGIGPTHDDITADCIALAFGVRIDVRQDARQMLAANYPNGEADLNPARLRMARIPDGARLIVNSVSRAPGFSLENVHVLAGVPKIFVAMLEELLPGLAHGTPLRSQTLRIYRQESSIAGPLAAIAKRHPKTSIGSYPFSENGVYGSNLVIRGQYDADVTAAKAEIENAFRDIK